MSDSASINNIKCNSKSSNREFNPSIYKKQGIMSHEKFKLQLV